eukprot:m.193006 g.193006  ORF g.193006 m.193006 type:complete len:64 (+) comp16971_c0_seq5:2721-2912(+)
MMTSSLHRLNPKGPSCLNLQSSISHRTSVAKLGIEPGEKDGVFDKHGKVLDSWHVTWIAWHLC